MRSKIFLIDDDAECIKKIRHIVKTEELAITSVVGYDEKHDVSEFCPTDIIILEIMMFNSHTGRRFLKKYTNTIQTYQSPIMVLTDLKRDKYLSPDHYVDIDWKLVKSTLNKPFETSVFINCIKYLLSNHANQMLHKTLITKV